MDDPGDTDEQRLIEMFPKFIFVTAIIAVIIFFAYFFVFKNIKTDTIEREVFFNRLIYSPNGLAYYDEDLGRTYLGRIDLDKFDTEYLENGINYTKNYFFAANITLITQKGKSNVYYHEDLYYKLKPLAMAKIKGLGGADRRIKEYIVSYFEDGTLRSGSLRIEVFRARS